MNSPTPTNAARQGSTGSRAAASRVQAKLRVSRGHDSYEQEADRVAGVVVGSPASSRAGAGAPAGVQRLPEPGPVAARVAPAISRLAARTPLRSLQTQEEEEAQTALQRAEEKEEPRARVQRQQEEEEEAQTKEEPRGEEEKRPQRKLQLQSEEEQEPQARVQRQEEEKEEAQTKSAEEKEPRAKLQLQEEEEAQAKAEPRLSGRDKRMFPELGRVENKLYATKGKGEPLPEQVRIDMETGFGANFSQVRVHTGGDAVEMSRELKAQAFTHGRDVFFNSGKYEPDSVRGKTLLAHELTHVVQQQAAEQKIPEQRIAEHNAARTQVEERTAHPEEQDAKKPGAPVAPIVMRPAEAPAAGTAIAGTAAPLAESAVAAPAGAEAEKAAAGPEPVEKPVAGKAEPAREIGGQELRGPEAAVKPAPELGEAKPAAKPAAGVVDEFLRRSTRAAFEGKKTGITRLARAQAKKTAAVTKLAQTEKAVAPPAQEAQSRANAGQVQTVDRAQAPAAEERQAKTKFNEALNQAIPKTLEEVDQFKEAGKGRVVGQAVRAVVTADTQEVKGTYQEIENAPPAGAPEQKPEDLPEVEAAPETPAIAMGEGVVGEVRPEHTDVSEFGAQSDQLLEKEQIKEEHLEMVDEGDLAEAKQDRQTVKTKVREGPAEVRQLEQDEKKKVSADLQKEEQQGKQSMQAERRKELHGARDDQKKTKSKLELQRQAVTEHINGTYEKANSAVKQKLDDLEQKSLAAFDEGQTQATQSFESNVKRRMDDFKSRRYGRPGGGLLWAKDKLFGMDELPEVKEIFDSEKARFVTAVDGLINRITADNQRVIQECREIIANARKDIEKYVQGLGPELKKVGNEALNDMRGKLDALDQKINAKEEELKQKLAAKREAAIKAIDDKIAKMKEEMSGLVSKLGRLMLDAMVKFFKWALKKAGYASDQLMGIINKGKEVIRKIVTDPIGFIKNLVKAVRDGVDLFWQNIKKHLIAGLMNWLTGAMSDVPITFPDKWDLKGVIFFILQILGISWSIIRNKLVKRLGEKVVRIAETTVDVVKRLISEGPMGLWEMLKEKAEQIKQQVMEGIRNWAMWELVKQGIMKLVSFLNPVGAIVQAIIAIYNTIMFFVENWERIVEFVKTLFGSIADIAMGKLSAAAAAVERALGMTVTIILSFLARLLGLSGIGKAVSNILKKIRKPIDKVVNKVVDVVARLAHKLLGKVKAGAKALKEKGLALIQWWKKKMSFGSRDGGQHRLYYRGSGGAAQLMVATTPLDLPTFLKQKKTAAKDREQRRDIREAEKWYGKVEKEQSELEKLQGKPKSKANDKAITKQDKAHYAALVKLSEALAVLKFEAETELAVRTQVTALPSGTKAVEAYPLSWLPGSPPGSPPKQDPPGWEHAAMLNADPKQGGAIWKRGHLVSERLHGPGMEWNLVPITQTLNSQMEAGAESAAKQAIREKGSLFWYKAQVTKFYTEKSGLIRHFPKSVEISWGRVNMERKGGTPSFTKGRPIGAPFRTSVQEVPEEGALPNLNTLGEENMRVLVGVSRRFAQAVSAERDKSGRGHFKGVGDFEKRIKTHQAHTHEKDTLERWIDVVRVAQDPASKPRKLRIKKLE